MKMLNRRKKLFYRITQVFVVVAIMLFVVFSPYIFNYYLKKKVSYTIEINLLHEWCVSVIDDYDIHNNNRYTAFLIEPIPDKINVIFPNAYISMLRTGTEAGEEEIKNEPVVVFGTNSILFRPYILLVGRKGFIPYAVRETGKIKVGWDYYFKWDDGIWCCFIDK